METVRYTGLRAGEYVMARELSRGPLFVVCEAHDAARPDKRAAVKFAKAQDEVSASGTQSFPSQAKGIFTGFVGKVHPDAFSILEEQAHHLQQCRAAVVPSVEMIERNSAVCYMVMEYLEGQTLRDLQQSKMLSSEDLFRTIGAVVELERVHWKHGDLKPDNIMILGSGGVCLLDPGFFKKVNCKEGKSIQCAVTTVEYYPSLAADDTFALGIILFELIAKWHPLIPRVGASEVRCTSDLNQFLTRFEAAGQNYFAAIRQFESEVLRDMSVELQEFLLRAIRLKKTPDGLDLERNVFVSAKQIMDALKPLRAEIDRRS